MAKKTDEQIDAEMTQAIKDGTELEGWTRVPAKVSKSPRAVYGLRLSAEEFAEFSSAAKVRGLTLSDFLRQAATDAIHGNVSHEEAQAMKELKELAARITRIAS